MWTADAEIASPRTAGTLSMVTLNSAAAIYATTTRGTKTEGNAAEEQDYEDPPPLPPPLVTENESNNYEDMAVEEQNSAEDNTYYEDVKDALEKAGAVWPQPEEDYDRVEPNLTSVMALARQGNSHEEDEEYIETDFDSPEMISGFQSSIRRVRQQGSVGDDSEEYVDTDFEVRQQQIGGEEDYIVNELIYEDTDEPEDQYEDVQAAHY